MRITFLSIISLLSFLPLILAAVVPSIPPPTTPNALSKRRYTAFPWAIRISTARTFGGIFLEIDCYVGVSIGHYRFDWPFETRGGDLVICKQVYTKCGATPKDQLNRESVLQCPEEEHILIQSLVDAGTRWSPSLSHAEATEAVKFVTASQGVSQSQAYRMSVGAVSDVGAGVAAPTATQGGVVGGCKRWHVAVSGDSCYWIAQNNGVGLDQFYGWNQEVNNGGECMGLWLGYSYCVGV